MGAPPVVPGETDQGAEIVAQDAPFTTGSFKAVEDAQVAAEDLQTFSISVELQFLTKALRLSEMLKANHILPVDSRAAAKIHWVADGIRTNCPTKVDKANLTPMCRDYIQRAMPELLRASDGLRTISRN